MDMETVLSIAFVAVIILFQVFGAVFSRLIKRGQAASEKPAKAGGLIKTLASRVNRELQQALQQAAAARAGQDKQNGDIAALFQSQTADRTLSGDGRDRPPAGKKPPGRPKTAAGHSAAGPSVRHQAAGGPVAIDPILDDEDLINEIRQGLFEEEALKTDESMPVAPKPGYAVADLRRAVIWSEILAPPLALRE